MTLEFNPFRGYTSLPRPRGYTQWVRSCAPFGCLSSQTTQQNTSFMHITTATTYSNLWSSAILLHRLEGYLGIDIRDTQSDDINHMAGLMFPEKGETSTSTYPSSGKCRSFVTPFRLAQLPWHPCVRRPIVNHVAPTRNHAISRVPDPLRAITSRPRDTPHPQAWWE